MIENLGEIKAQANNERICNALGIYIKDGGGSEARGNCPFEDHRKSDRPFAINLETGSWICHACGKSGGDIIQLVIDCKEMSFPDATNFVADCSGMNIDTFVPATKLPRKSQSDSKPKITPQQIEQKLKTLKPLDVTQSYPYLKEKCVDPCEGLYLGKDYAGIDSVVVPFKDVNGVLQTGQYVHAGQKPFFTGSSTLGAFFIIGSFKDGDTVYLGEGLATALTIWMALGKKAPVISYGSANNMVHSINALKKKYPNLKIIVCLDFGDAAFKQAIKINPAHGCRFTWPSFEGLINYTENKLSDFNDLISKCKQPLTLIREQLMIEKYLPASEQEMAPAEAKADAELSSFNVEYQEEILNYLFNQSFDNVIQDGFSPESFEIRLFTGQNRLIMEGIIKSWERGDPLSITQIAIDSGNSSKAFYETLKRIEGRLPISAKRVAERINALSHDYSRNSLKAALSEAQTSNQSPHEIIDRVRSQFDDIHSGLESMMPQSHYLHQIVDNIKNPKYKPLATGIASLDRLIGGGFIKTELGMLAGGAGAGKTAFALQIADSIAAAGGIVIYISVEIGVHKLTERSLKRLCYGHDLNLEAGINKYQTFANNIYLRKGRHGMLVSEIRGMTLNVMRQHRGKDVLLIIDPFQRLGTGNEKIDYTNETLKVSTLSSQIKEMAESLSIPILALSDTTKDHKNDKEGHAMIRGSYMANHTADYVMMLRASRCPFFATYGDKKRGSYRCQEKHS